MALKRYSEKEPNVFVWVILPYAIIINLLIFGGCIFSSFSFFIESLLYTSVYFFTIYLIFGFAALLIRKRLPADNALFKRIGIMLPTFYVMNALAIYGFFSLTNATSFISCPVKLSMFWWTVLYGCIASTVITFINEAVANWEKWKNSIAETERLHNAYQHSKLLGLKGQMNPQFLFNSFHTLSELILENEVEAERFLEEMVKVHRYLLRSDDNYLIPLADEIKFAESYLYLAQVRFGGL